MTRNTDQLTSERQFAYSPPGIPVGDRSPQPAAVPPLFSKEAWDEVACSLGLSGRELEIVQGVFRDDTEYAIAAELGISSHTVHTHFERLYHKLGVTDRAQLILRVVHEILALKTLPGTTLSPICANFAAGRCPLRS